MNQQNLKCTTFTDEIYRHLKKDWNLHLQTRDSLCKSCTFRLL